MHQNRDLSRQLLTQTVETLERSQQQQGQCNFLAARFAGNAALLLEFDDLVNRFIDLLTRVTPNHFWSSFATNVPRTDQVPPGIKHLSSLEDIERDHPLMTDDYLSTMISDSEEHLKLCLAGEYEAAFAIADSELFKEEVALTQAVLGDIELAIESCDRLSEQHRSANVLFVATIELYRHNRIPEAEALHAQLASDSQDVWGPSQMALGVVNRVPWPGYPYPDY